MHERWSHTCAGLIRALGSYVRWFEITRQPQAECTPDDCTSPPLATITDLLRAPEGGADDVTPLALA